MRCMHCDAEGAHEGTRKCSNSTECDLRMEQAEVAILRKRVAELEAELECQVDGIAPCSGAGKTEADWCRMCLVAEYRKARNGLASTVAEGQAKYGRELQQALTRIANLEAEKLMAVAEEREACAKVAERFAIEESPAAPNGMDDIAAAIRARGKS